MISLEPLFGCAHTAQTLKIEKRRSAYLKNSEAGHRLRRTERDFEDGSTDTIEALDNLTSRK